MNAAPDVALRVLPGWLAAHADATSGETSMEYLARHSHSFRYAAKFLPAPYDTLVADVYAFCRFTDDLVDVAPGVPPMVLRGRLDAWRDLARAAYAGNPSGLALLDRPMEEMARRGIPFELAEDLVAGVAMDLERRRYATLEELDTYSHRVASVVGLWLTRLAGVDHPVVLERAAELGHAMQLTNILRDVGEDWTRGRLYLPLDVLARHGVTEADIAAAISGDGLPRGWLDAMEELMAVAEARYARAIEAVSALPAFFRRPVMVAAYVYRDIHVALRRNGHDNLRRRAHTGLWRKLALGCAARVRLALAPAFDADRAAPAGMADAGLLGGVASVALALVLSVAEAVPARTASGERNAPPVLRAGLVVERELRRALHAAEESLRAQPRRADLRLEHLRLLHTLSVLDVAALPRARAARAELERMAHPDAHLDDVLLAYRGALEVVEARHAFWPPARLEPLRRGLPMLDSAVARAPHQAEVRYLRLTSGYYLPSFLGRASAVREDFDALAGLLPRAPDAFPPFWYVAIADFVLEHGRLPDARRAPLHRARGEAAAMLRRSTALPAGETRGPDWSSIP